MKAIYALPSVGAIKLKVRTALAESNDCPNSWADELINQQADARAAILGKRRLARFRKNRGQEEASKGLLRLKRSSRSKALLSNEGRTMAEPTDTEEAIAVTSRRRFLRDGGALAGGAVIAGGLAGREALAASESTDNLPPTSRNG
jgi:hypothetical protein